MHNCDHEDAVRCFVPAAAEAYMMRDILPTTKALQILPCIVAAPQAPARKNISNERVATSSILLQNNERARYSTFETARSISESSQCLKFASIPKSECSFSSEAMSGVPKSFFSLYFKISQIPIKLKNNIYLAGQDTM